jgi:hypothetical protein
MIDPHGEERGTRGSLQEARLVASSFETRLAPFLRMRGQKNPAFSGRAFRNRSAWLGADQILLANLDAAEAPLITIPETLTLPVTAFHVNRGRRSLARGNRAADDGATDDAAGNRGAESALRAGRGRGERAGNHCDSKERSKCLVHVLDSPGDAAPVQRQGLGSIRTPSLEFTLSPKEAHNGQPKVNVLTEIRLKNGFFGPTFP